MGEKEIRQYPMMIGGHQLLRIVPVKETKGKDSQTGKPVQRRRNPVAKAAGRYNREKTQASDRRHDGIYTTQNGAQITIKQGQIADVVGELTEGDQFTLQESLAPGMPKKPSEKVGNVAKAMWYGSFEKKKPATLHYEGMIAVNMRVPGTKLRIHWIDQDALPNAFTITRENAERLANAFPQSLKKSR